MAIRTRAPAYTSVSAGHLRVSLWVFPCACWCARVCVPREFPVSPTLALHEALEGGQSTYSTARGTRYTDRLPQWHYRPQRRQANARARKLTRACALPNGRAPVDAAQSSSHCIGIQLLVLPIKSRTEHTALLWCEVSHQRLCSVGAPLAIPFQARTPVLPGAR